MVEVPFLLSMYLLLVSVVYILQLAYDAVDYLICLITCQSSWQLQTNYLMRNQVLVLTSTGLCKFVLFPYLLHR